MFSAYFIEMVPKVLPLVFIFIRVFLGDLSDYPYAYIHQCYLGSHIPSDGHCLPSPVLLPFQFFSMSPPVLTEHLVGVIARPSWLGWRDSLMMIIKEEFVP